MPKASRKKQTSMEESADALAGVEGALKGGKRKASPVSSGSNKKSKTERPRSNSINELAEVASTILKDGEALATAAAAAAAATTTTEVPNPMATPMPPLPKPTGTGFRKQKAAAAQPKASNQVIAAAKVIVTKPPGDDGKQKKAQIKYNPEVAMSKEQLTSWRREMRRVRNRESAAASRRKVRDKIEELEDEVAVWKKRYQEVLERLGDKGDGGEKHV